MNCHMHAVCLPWEAETLIGTSAGCLDLSAQLPLRVHLNLLWTVEFCSSLTKLHCRGVFGNSHDEATGIKLLDVGSGELQKTRSLYYDGLDSQQHFSYTHSTPWLEWCPTSFLRFPLMWSQGRLASLTWAMPGFLWSIYKASMHTHNCGAPFPLRPA